MLQICGQVNNYPRPALRFQRQLAAQALTRSRMPWIPNPAILSGLIPTPLSFTSRRSRVLLKQGNGDLAGVGVFTDVIEQLLQQPIEGETHRFALWVAVSW